MSEMTTVFFIIVAFIALSIYFIKNIESLLCEGSVFGEIYQANRDCKNLFQSMIMAILYVVIFLIIFLSSVILGGLWFIVLSIVILGLIIYLFKNN